MKKALFVCLLSVMAVLAVFAGPERSNKHTVKKGETLYSISRTYGVKVKELIKANPSLSLKSSIRPGQKITIPGKAEMNERNETAYHAPVKKPTAAVTVPSTPDTPYRDEDDKTRQTKGVEEENPMATINSDQPVINSRPVAVAESTPYSLRTNASNPADYAGVFNQYTAHGYKVSRTRGAANFIEDNTSGNPYLALYSNAETGSVIKVTNLMNKRSVYVKVVGRVPATDASKEVVLKLSNKVAKELGALDDKFLVEVVGVQSN